MLTLCFGIAKLTLPQVVNGAQHKNKEAKMRKSKRFYIDGFREIQDYVRRSVPDLRRLKVLSEQLRELKFYNPKFSGPEILGAYLALDRQEWDLVDEYKAEGFDFDIYANSDEMFI
jgi:hypothetical protein